MTDRPQSIEKMLARAGAVLIRLAPYARMVEVGVYNGLMSEHILQHRPDVTWHGIDPWRRQEEQSAAYMATGDPHARLTIEQQDGNWRKTRNRLARFGPRATIHRVASPEASDLFTHASIDLVFLDGDHSYEGVRADCAAWWPIVKTGGWLGGHDYKNQNPNFRLDGVHRAVDEFVACETLDLELDHGTTWWVEKS